jgi:type II secretory pathway pseudopilin PulG
MAVTTAAVIGIASTAATTGMSFAQAGKQRKAMNQAERDAEEAMQAARKKLEVNVFDQLAIQKEPFELEREALLSQGAQAIQAGVESERGAAATAGRVQMAQQEGQAGIRSAMGQQLQSLEMLSAQEEGRLRDIGVQLDLEEVAGAQLAAANAQELQAQAMRQGMEGVTSLGGQIASTIPLFARNRGVEKLAIGDMSFTTEEFAKFENVSEKAGLGAALDDGFTNLDLQAVSSMSNPEYNRFVRSLTPKQRTMLFTNPQFLEKIGSMSPGAARLIR